MSRPGRHYADAHLRARKRASCGRGHARSALLFTTGLAASQPGDATDPAGSVRGPTAALTPRLAILNNF